MGLPLHFTLPHIALEGNAVVASLYAGTLGMLCANGDLSLTNRRTAVNTCMNVVHFEAFKRHFVNRQ